jgi:GMP synthase-like glutamine amidotransferase
MKILAIYNHFAETLGTLKQFLKDVEEEHAENIKGDEEFDALIIMGGPMGVYEADKYPFLAREMELIKRAYKQRKRILGICLGSQLIAETLGGKVMKGQFGCELGLQKVKLLDEMKEFFGKEELDVFQYHCDTFTLPPNSKLLAYSEKYYQAFRIERILALQFHIEVDSDMVKRWSEVYGLDIKFVEEVKRYENELKKKAESMINYWLSLK